MDKRAAAKNEHRLRRQGRRKQLRLKSGAWVPGKCGPDPLTSTKQREQSRTREAHDIMKRKQARADRRAKERAQAGV
jgi:hypothetical protein